MRSAPKAAAVLPAAADIISTRLGQHLQEVMQVQAEMHTTMSQAESCLQTFGGYQQLTAPGLAQPPNLETALQSPPGSSEQLDRAVCLANPAEQVEEEVMVLDEGSNGVAG